MNNETQDSGRQLTDHHVEGKAHRTIVTAVDEVEFGASHVYNLSITGPDGCKTTHRLNFQKGPVQDPSSTPGICNESLLTVVLDRLQGFQTTPHACDANAIAIHSIRTGLHALTERTRERIDRNVEGTHTV